MTTPENQTKDGVDALENENLPAHNPNTMGAERFHGKSKHCPKE
jgi:hypothetical protein